MRTPGQTFVLVVTFIVAVTAVARAETMAGRWDAVVTIGDAEIPFRLDIAGEAPALRGTLYNGDVTQTTTSTAVENGKVVLRFKHYLTTITVASTADGRLEGTVEGRFEAERYITWHPLRATKHTPRTAAVAGVPSIAGEWVIPYNSAKGEKAWRFIVRQTGANASAAILRIDGDTGTLTGTYQEGRFVLSHFDAQRPLRLEVTSKPDDTLELRMNGPFSVKTPLTAYRTAVARAKGLPEPANFNTHTSLRDPNEVFAFKFPDQDGKVWSNEDPKFKGKVVVAVVTGTWCPNCHDEARYLVQLYKEYRDRGLEVVALNFEEPEQQDELARVRAFVKKYGVEYTYLIAGAPVEMWEKVPQGVNLNTWPATFFVGRDGRVQRIHAGFAAPASGQYHEALKAEFTATIERLLAESSRAAE